MSLFDRKTVMVLSFEQKCRYRQHGISQLMNKTYCLSLTHSLILISLLLKGLASHVAASPDLLWDVPKSWTMNEAASVPMAYVTAYYALRVRANARRNSWVLIHSASSAVGQAAIRYILYNNYVIIFEIQKIKGSIFISLISELQSSLVARCLQQLGQKKSVSFLLRSLEQIKTASLIQDPQLLLSKCLLSPREKVWTSFKTKHSLMGALIICLTLKVQILC